MYVIFGTRDIYSVEQGENCCKPYINILLILHTSSSVNQCLTKNCAFKLPMPIMFVFKEMCVIFMTFKCLEMSELFHLWQSESEPVVKHTYYKVLEILWTLYSGIGESEI